MKISGLQKLTLLDFPGRIACTVFTAGCNFRCPFCHNASLVVGADGDELREREKLPGDGVCNDNDLPDGGVSEEEFFAFLAKRTKLLDGVCVTGGEPLLQPDLAVFLRKIKEMGFAVKLDTNGSFPKKLKSLVAEGLVDYVAMDVKNAPSRYAETVGRPSDRFDLAAIDESIRFLLAGTTDYEFRTTIVRGLHAKEDLDELGSWIAGAKRYFLQSFVDSGDLIVCGLEGLEKAETEPLLEAVRVHVPSAQLRGV